MALPSNTYSSYDMVGIREDLSDILKDISPVDTMYFSSLGSAPKPKNRKVEWQYDALAAVDTTNYHLEGDNETAAALTPTTRIYNNLQIMKKVFTISNSAPEFDTAGRSDEVDYQTAKKSRELAKDNEYFFLQGVRQDGAEGTEPKMRGFLNWIVTNLNKAADATLNADGTVTGGTARAFTESILKTTLQNVYTAGGNPSIAYLGVYQKGVVSSWSQAASNYRIPVEDKKLNAVIDVYVGDFGAIAFKCHRGMPTSVVVLVDPAHKGKKATLRNTHRERLAITGDSQTWAIRVEHTLRDLYELAHGRITTLSVS